MRAHPAKKRNVGGAVAVLLVGIASLVIGLHALSHVDRCGEHTMSQGELCPNYNSRSGHAWTNDADQQHARNHRVGVAMLAGGGGFVASSGLIYRFTSGELRRRRQRRSTPDDGVTQHQPRRQ